MLRVVVVLLLMALAPLTGRAAPVTVAFEGVLDRIWDDFGLFGDATEGTPFSGTYFYDDAIAGNICEGVLTLDQCAVYDFSSQASAGMTLEFGGVSFSFFNADGDLRTPLTILVRDFLLDTYVVTWERSFEGDLATDFVEIGLRDPTLPSTGLGEGFLGTTELIAPTFGPSNPPHLHRLAFTARFSPPQTILEIVDGRIVERVIPGQESFASGEITSLREVPEPTALALLGLALAALLASRAVRAGAGP